MLYNLCQIVINHIPTRNTRCPGKSSLSTIMYTSVRQTRIAFEDAISCCSNTTRGQKKNRKRYNGREREKEEKKVADGGIRTRETMDFIWYRRRWQTKFAATVVGVEKIFWRFWYDPRQSIYIYMRCIYLYIYTEFSEWKKGNGVLGPAEKIGCDGEQGWCWRFTHVYPLHGPVPMIFACAWTATVARQKRLL